LLRGVRLSGFAAPLLVVALLMRPPALYQVPLFAQYGSEEPTLRSYSVPVHMSIALHKLITWHFGFNGMMYFRRPAKLALSIHEIPEKYQHAFAELGTPRTWPQTYAMQVVGKDDTDGHCVFHLRGTPLQSNDIDYMLVDVAGPNDPIKATWYLRGGGTISSTITLANVGDYSMPKDQQMDVDAQGTKVHVDLSYGDYDLNAEISDALF